MKRWLNLYNRIAVQLQGLASVDLLTLAARVGVGAVFWLSGRTKVDEHFRVTDTAVALFADEFKLPLLPPDAAAHVAAYAEHLFPLLLFVGLFTRFSALALLVMTVVIQVFVYPQAWPTHLSWAAGLLVLLHHGGGRLSLDHLLGLK